MEMTSVGNEAMRKGAVIVAVLIAVLAALILVGMQRSHAGMADNHKRGQNEMTKMFRVFHDLCEDLGLSYWAIGGVLIGAVRSGGWVEWDGDVDVCMFEDDFSVLLRNRDMLPSWMFVQIAEEDVYYDNHEISKIRHKYARYADWDPALWHHGLQIDIWRIRRDGNGWQAMLSDGTFGDDPDSTVSAMMRAGERNLPLVKLPFEGIDMWVSADYQNYLTELYGGCPPALPPPEQRKCHEGTFAFDVPDVWKTMYRDLYRN